MKTLKAALARLKPVLANPVVKPVEVWAVRAALGYVAVKLGVGVDHLATK